MSRTSRTSLATCAIALASACATSQGSNMPPSVATLDKYELGVLPGPISMARVLARPNERFVMVNLLVFKDEATKPYEGITGRAAYQKYVETVVKIQGPMDSKLLWNGNVTDQLVGDSEPRFEVAALLEYCLLYTSPSPRDATLSRMPSSA